MRLAAQRLLGDQGVRSDRAGVDLIRDQVAEFHHVDVADHDFLLETVASASVVDDGLAVGLHPSETIDFARLLHVIEDFLLVDAVEDRRGHFESERLGSDAEVGLEDLTDVHAARHAERIEHDVNRGAVGEERHVLLGHDLGHHTLVAVAPGHLVAHA